MEYTQTHASTIYIAHLLAAGLKVNLDSEVVSVCVESEVGARQATAVK